MRVESLTHSCIHLNNNLGEVYIGLFAYFVHLFHSNLAQIMTLRSELPFLGHSTRSRSASDRLWTWGQNLLVRDSTSVHRSDLEFSVWRFPNTASISFSRATSFLFLFDRLRCPLRSILFPWTSYHVRLPDFTSAHFPAMSLK